MLNFKKLAFAVCGFVLALSTTMISAYAAYDVDITSGAYAEEDITMIRINVPGISTEKTGTEANFSRAGTIKLAVKPKGVFKTYAPEAIVEYDFSNPSRPKTYLKSLQTCSTETQVLPDVKVSPESPSDYDIVVISWANADPCFAPLGIVDIKCTYADAVNKGDATFTVLSDSLISTWDVNKENVVSDAAFNANPYVYTLASGTTDITKTEASGNDPAPATTATVLGDHTGDKETEGDEADTTDKAVAILGTPAAPESRATSLVWTVTPNTGDAQQFTQVVDVEGGATYKFGLVLRNITEDLIKTVSAVLQ